MPIEEKKSEEVENLKKEVLLLTERLSEVEKKSATLATELDKKAEG